MVPLTDVVHVSGVPVGVPQSTVKDLPFQHPPEKGKAAHFWLSSTHKPQPRSTAVAPPPNGHTPNPQTPEPPKRRETASSHHNREQPAPMALDIRIAGKYRLGRKIGGGSFGDIYLGEACSRLLAYFASWRSSHVTWRGPASSWVKEQDHNR